MERMLFTLRSHFRNPQLVALLLVLTGGILVVLYFGDAIAPFITSLVVAYLLEGMIRPLVRWRMPRILAVLLVFGLFMFLLVILFGVVIPILAEQLSHLLGEIPRMTATLQTLKGQVAGSLQGVISANLMEPLLARLLEGFQDLTARSVTYLLHGVPGLFSIVIYLFLVPFLVFFFLKDKAELLRGMQRLLPHERDLLYKVLRDVDRGLGGYIRGKFWELLLLGAVTYLCLAYIGSEYAFLLGLLTGLSVLIPFLGVVVVIIPVVLLGMFQWGVTMEAFQPLMIYGIVQMVDGNLVAPLILGETVRVHPTTIILAVLLFGSLWGLLGVFFAVPLAVLVKSVVDVILPHEENS
ncbi:MAG: AI-2E family transporter [Magnetococcales bacterium]|nr:AI-2E family transporter [Magnetococcales bacterium]MBF0322833.1 AI-2E family transporter [Magnetococcales bacterium]